MRVFAALAVLTLLGAAPVTATAFEDVDVGLEVGVGTSNNAGSDHLARLTLRGLALGEKRSSAGWSLWWEASVGGWRYDKGNDREHLLDIGAAPLLRYMSRGTEGFFGELSVGVHYLSDLYERGGLRFSTGLQFSPTLGVGYRFEDGAGEIALRFQHVSNAGIKQPNPGVEFLLLSVSRTF